MNQRFGPCRTIKSLVLDCVHRTGGVVDYQALTSEVLRHSPVEQNCELLCLECHQELASLHGRPADRQT